MNMNPGGVKDSREAKTQADRRPPDPAVRNSVSVVMVIYHTGPVLFEAIDSVLSQDDLCDLVLVDNGSSPVVLAELKGRADEDGRLIVLTGHGNVGFAAGCNLGARQARGAYLLFLNPDCLMPPGGLRRLLAEGESWPRPWMLGCRLVGADGNEQRGARRDVLTPWTALVEVLRLDRLAPDHPYFRRFNRHALPAPKETSTVPVTSGACMMLPAEDYWALDGMDEGYFVHVEDIDFCHRFRAAGGEIYFVPHVAVTHILSTSETSPLFIEWHKTRGFIRYFRKNFAGVYPPMFLPLVNAGILARFALKACTILAHGLFDALAAGRRSPPR